MTDAAESPDRAIKLLQDAGFLYRPVHCPACAEPVGRLLARPGVSPDQRYHRCSSKSCKKYTNALWFGCFVGAACAQKLTPRQQAQCVVQYLNYEKLPPSAADVASDLKVGVAAVRQTIDKLRAAEASMGQTESDGVLLDGDVEMDEHSFRKFYVSRNNVHFAEAIAREDHKEDHPFFVVHLRCIGMRRRGGRALFIKMLPMRPLPPGSRPPPLSNEELLNSKILDHVVLGSTVLYTDGAQAYPSVISQVPGLKVQQVSHAKMEFAKRVPWVRAGSSTMGGTQCLDSTWAALDKFIPKTVLSKDDHNVSNRLMQYIWAGVYRVSHRDESGVALVGAALRMA